MRFRCGRVWALAFLTALLVGCTGEEPPSATAEPSPRATVTPTPTPSEDAYEIAFTSKRDGYWSIYLVDEEGTQSRFLDVTTVKLGPKRAWLDLLGQVAWSPNAPVFAFTCAPRRSEICIALDNGSSVKQVTRARPHGEGYPEWTPDGNRLLFSSHRNGSSNIYSVRADGTGERPVVAGPNDEFAADISADGKSLAYVEIRADRFWMHLARLRGDGSLQIFKTIKDATLPARAPSGNKLVFNRYRNRKFSDLYMMSGDGTQLERLTRSPGLDYWATWSPDGRMIAFDRGVDLNEKKKKYMSSDIHILDLENGETRNITNDDTLNMQPAWRPQRTTAP